MTKCKALVKVRAKLDEAGRVTAAGNEWADELFKEGARDDSFQSILYGTFKTAVEASKAIVSYIGNFILTCALTVIGIHWKTYIWWCRRGTGGNSATGHARRDFPRWMNTSTMLSECLTKKHVTSQ